MARARQASRGRHRDVARRVLLAAGAVAIAAAFGGMLPPLGAQAPAAGGETLAFEVASVKPNKSGGNDIRFGLLPGGRFNAVNVPARQLVVFAFAPLQPFQITGGQGWINSDRFDITAKAETDPGPQAPGTSGPMQLMMRSLLAERFKLKTHRETREMPTYALTLARNDGRLGANLKQTSPECAERMAAGGRGLRAGGAPGVGVARGGPGPGQPPGFAPPASGEPAPCGALFAGPASIGAGGTTMEQLAQMLSQRVARVVVDKTGLTGRYDLTLTFTPEQAPRLNGVAPPDGAALPGLDPNAPSIFTALQEQLGLKLDSQRGQVEMLVIDSVEPPTPD